MIKHKAATICIVLLLSVSFLFPGCGLISSPNQEVLPQDEECTPQYFANRYEIENWLSSVQKPPKISADTDEWFVYAVYYQRKAFEDRYILSVSYTFSEEGESIAVTCDVMTVDGNIYYFDPDDGILQDTGLRIPLEDYNLETLDKTSLERKGKTN